MEQHFLRQSVIRVRAIWLLVVLVGLGSNAGAQVILEGREALSFNRPESWAMKYFASLTLPTGFGAPDATDPGSVDLHLEGGWVPELSEQQRRVGFNGTKVENLNRTSAFGRIGLTVGLPAGFSVGLGWVPSIEMDGVEANLLALSVGRSIWERDPWRLGLRLLGQIGTLEGDITCSRADVAGGSDPQLNPFGCEAPSSDQVDIQSLGAELSAAVRIGLDDNFELFGSLALVSHDLEFQVNARYSGIADRTLLLTDGTTTALTAGLNYFPAERWRVGGEIFYSPLDVTRPPAGSSQNDALWNLRVIGSYRIR